MSQPANNPSDDIDDDRRKIRKAKRVSLFQFRKKRRKGVATNPPPPPPPPFRAGCFGNIGGGGAGGGCLHCCLKPNPRVDSSPVEPKPSSDPNSPNFTFELLRALVEKNDFYSKECNPHFDIPEADDN
ncbi:hypothetical protein Vadar_023721 [Vaccinium darrowii]|uniref:Uncharacterized protein n=1 Tax=Vaccinium darrowii TaxID=229202 RepID=A0ACB7X395_9ERIC|nr:hypothetical protein Vadar_023721 [Vaccinium darrowii]